MNTIDFNKTLFEVKAVIKRTNGDVAPKTAHVASVNNTLHSLFSQLDVSFKTYMYSKVTNYSVLQLQSDYVIHYN